MRSVVELIFQLQLPHNNCKLFLCSSGYVVASIQQELSQNHPQVQITFGLLGIIFKWRSKKRPKEVNVKLALFIMKMGCVPFTTSSLLAGVKRNEGNVRNPWLSNPQK